MKKTISLLLIFVLAVGLVSCGGMSEAEEINDWEARELVKEQITEAGTEDGTVETLMAKQFDDEWYVFLCIKNEKRILFKSVILNWQDDEWHMNEEAGTAASTDFDDPSDNTNYGNISWTDKVGDVEVFVDAGSERTKETDRIYGNSASGEMEVDGLPVNYYVGWDE